MYGEWSSRIVMASTREGIFAPVFCALMVRSVSTMFNGGAMSGIWAESALCDSLWEMLRTSVSLETSGEESSIGPLTCWVVSRVNVDGCPLEGDVGTPIGDPGGECGKGYKAPDWGVMTDYVGRFRCPVHIVKAPGK